MAAMGHASDVSRGGHGGGTLIERINNLRASSLPFAAPKRALQTTEASLVRDVLQVLQGYPTSILPWNPDGQCFYVRNGIHVLHLSQSSLYNILQLFTGAGTSLRRVDSFVQRVLKGTAKSWLKSITQARPTLEAFVNVVQMRLESLRVVALEKELEAAAGKAGTGVTLLSLFANLSRVFAGAEFLEHVVNVAVPEPDKLYENDINAGQLATHILSTLYEELDSFCLIQDGQEDAYGTLLLLFVGCLWPMITSLDAWLREGILCDPAGELFFFEDKSVPIENSAFWESGFHFRDSDALTEENSSLPLLDQKQGSSQSSPKAGPNGNSRRFSTDSNARVGAGVPQSLVCPNFLQPLAKAILSAGKSLQLLQHVRRKHTEGDRESPQAAAHVTSRVPSPFLPVGLTSLMQFSGRKGSSDPESIDNFSSGASQVSNSIGQDEISLFEQFCASLRALLGEASVKNSSEGTVSADPSYLYSSSDKGIPTKEDLLDELFFRQRSPKGGPLQYSNAELQGNRENTKVFGRNGSSSFSKPEVDTTTEILNEETLMDSTESQAPAANGEHVVKGFGMALVIDSESHLPLSGIQKGCLNLAQYCRLSALNDVQLRAAVFDACRVDKPHSPEKETGITSGSSVELNPSFEQTCSYMQTNYKDRVTDFNDSLACGKVLLLHDRRTLTAVEKLLQYPTMLPPLQERNVSKTLPSGKSNEEVVGMLQWIQGAALTATPASVVVQECLISSIQKQVDHVGHQLLAKLMGEWRLMEELALLRAIYLVGSGDLLQQFASVLFNKLDRGEPWDDFYELNTMLQESVRSSSHGMVVPALDSLVVTVLPRQDVKTEAGPRAISSPPQIAGRAPSFAINALDSLFFTYKVAWPLELIIDSNAIKKYNQVMLFLLQVKRAKHALDKACRWTWKKGVGDAAVHKRRLLLQQKLMHFVNTLHQYVMDRVLYSAWVDLCESMSSAGSLDEVIACHDAYLVSIQRQCLVAPDKLWTLIAGRVKTILGLALNYHSIQRVLCDGIGAPALTARCQLEIERVEKQFDECMVFLMRVLSFKLNVGHFPHLADLVTRINYNFYYMTEDGQLSTPLPDSLGQTPKRSSRRV
ncbi:unnamed protein product [Calypogeia fissa]